MIKPVNFTSLHASKNTFITLKVTVVVDNLLFINSAPHFSLVTTFKLLRTWTLIKPQKKNKKRPPQLSALDSADHPFMENPSVVRLAKATFI
jgi:hypothetical protein